MKDDRDTPINYEELPGYEYLKRGRVLREELDKNIYFNEHGHASLRIVGEPHYIYLNLINYREGVLIRLEQRVDDERTLNVILTQSEFIDRNDLQHQLTVRARMSTEDKRLPSKARRYSDEWDSNYMAQRSSFLSDRSIPRL